jgi:hypothetical protein
MRTADLAGRRSQRARVFLDGRVELARGGKSGAQVGARFHQSRLKLENLPVVLDRGLVVVTLLRGNPAAQQFIHIGGGGCRRGLPRRGLKAQRKEQKANKSHGN